MSDFDVVGYVASKGYEYRTVSGGREISFPCPNCGEAPNSKKKKVFASVDDGWWICFVCESKGGSYLLQKLFGDDPKVDKDAGTDPVVRRQALNWAADVGAAMLANCDEVMLYLLRERHLAPETILERRLGYIGNGWSLVHSLPEQYSREQLAGTGLVHVTGDRAGQDFFYNHLLIPYISRGSVVSIRGRSMAGGSGAKYMTGPGEMVRLFGTDTLTEADECILVEGEFDQMIVRQALELSPEDRVRRIAVVGVPGVGTFKDEWASYFTECRRVYVGFDPDDPGRRGALRVKEMLGTRTRIIEWPKSLLAQAVDMKLGIPDWTTYIGEMEADWHDVIDLMGSASGKRLYTVREAGVSYRNARTVGSGIKTGYKQFDDLIVPGVLPGQVVVLLAKTGVGKTLWLCNLAYFMRQHRILFLTLEMTREEVYERLMRIYLFHNPGASERDVDEALVNIWICDEGRISSEGFAQLIKEYEAEHGDRPETVFLDYLGYYARSHSGHSEYERLSDAISDLKEQAKAARVSVFTPSQVNRMTAEGRPIEGDAARGSGVIEETADFLLSIFAPDEAVQAEVDGQRVSTNTLRLQVLKSRHGGKGNVFSLIMDRLSLAIVDNPGDADVLVKRAKDHNFLYQRGYSWYDMRRAEVGRYSGHQAALGDADA